MAEDTAVSWRDFAPASFEAASDRGVPILLSITASWCRPCAEMDRDVYADPGVAESIEADFVPVRIDADRRPRVRDRYTMGGFPSTVFLTPSGELISGATQLNVDAFEQVTDRVREVWADRGPDAGRVPRSVRSEPPAGDSSAEIPRRIAERLRGDFDADYGGWGDGPKFPLPDTIEFALAHDPELATRTLDPIRQHLLDTADGGFYRYAEGRDWSDPHREKLLDENAALLRAFANGYLHTGDDAYRETAAGLGDFLTATLWVGGGFGASQVPADDSYYRAPPSDRADEPGIDATILAGRNALAIDALLTYHAYTDDDPARDYAERALASVEDLIEDGAVRRYDDPGAPVGVLLDQARVTRAFATAAQVLDPDYRAQARQVAEWTLETLNTDTGFVDGVGGPGLLERPLYPIDANAEMADALVDLHALTGEAAYHEAARTAVGAFAGAIDRFGPEQGAYGTAASRVVDEPLRIDVHDEVRSDLHRAALRVADHEKVVIPDVDGPTGTATVYVGGEAGTPVESPEELVSQVQHRIA